MSDEKDVKSVSEFFEYTRCPSKMPDASLPYADNLIHQFKIKTGSHSANVVIEMDGKPLRGLQRFTLDLIAEGTTKITLTMLGKVDAEGAFKLADQRATEKHAELVKKLENNTVEELKHGRELIAQVYTAAEESGVLEEIAQRDKDIQTEPAPSP